MLKKGTSISVLLEKAKPELYYQYYSRRQIHVQSYQQKHGLNVLNVFNHECVQNVTSQQALNCSQSTTETLEKEVKYVLSQQCRHQ